MINYISRSFCLCKREAEGKKNRKKLFQKKDLPNIETL